MSSSHINEWMLCYIADFLFCFLYITLSSCLFVYMYVTVLFLICQIVRQWIVFLVNATSGYSSSLGKQPCIHYLLFFYSNLLSGRIRSIRCNKRVCPIYQANSFIAFLMKKYIFFIIICS